MTYSPRGLCNSMEGGIQALAMTFANAAAAERQIDRSGPEAVALLTRHLRRERNLNRALAAELQLALQRLAEAEAALRRPRRSARP